MLGVFKSIEAFKAFKSIEAFKTFQYDFVHHTDNLIYRDSTLYVRGKRATMRSASLAWRSRFRLPGCIVPVPVVGQHVGYYEDPLIGTCSMFDVRIIQWLRVTDKGRFVYVD